MTIQELLVSALAIWLDAVLELAFPNQSPSHWPHTDTDHHVLNLYGS